MFREFVVHRRSSDRAREQQIVTAWHAASFNAKASVGKLPDLKVVLRKMRGIVKQEPDEQRSAFAQIAANLGKAPQQTRLIRKVR